jgi:hypothetical protein
MPILFGVVLLSMVKKKKSRDHVSWGRQQRISALGFASSGTALGQHDHIR